MPTLDEDSNQDNILVIAAEASSCMYAIRFIREWKNYYPGSHFFGVGDQKMSEEGMDCRGYAEDLAVVGLQEVIQHWDIIKKTFLDILDECDKRKPKFALLLDYPGFNLRLAKKLKERGIPVVYYISPQLWAWKKGRVKQVKEFVDDMLVVFPFEVEFYQKHGIQAHFVGHPLVEVVESELERMPNKKSEKKILGLMPGSRKSEIQHNFTKQLEAAEILKKENDIEVKVLVAPTLNHNDLKTLAGPLGEGVEFIKSAPTTMIHQCDLILSASGTATLQVALCEKPMSVMYRMNPITAFFAKLLVRSVESFCIVNLIAGKKIVPEFFQEQASPKKLAASLSKILNDSQYQQNMVNDLKAVKEKLGKGGATSNLVQYLRKKYC